MPVCMCLKYFSCDFVWMRNCNRFQPPSGCVPPGARVGEAGLQSPHHHQTCQQGGGGSVLSSKLSWTQAFVTGERPPVSFDATGTGSAGTGGVSSCPTSQKARPFPTRTHSGYLHMPAYLVAQHQMLCGLNTHQHVISRTLAQKS